jgi:hypothetical protein
MFQEVGRAGPQIFPSGTVSVASNSKNRILKEIDMKRILTSTLALAAALTVSLAQAQPLQTVGSDLKGAGHDTADASKKVAHKTASGTKTGYHKTVHGTKVVTHKTVEGTKIGADKTADVSKTVGKDTAHGAKVGATKTADVSKTGYHKTVNGTRKLGDKIAHKPAPATDQNPK